ncbi:hypothetical protein [Tenacibaculum amylolyticum]|uniref:hypothetical protein n=1 Tax=Tenacibaculum amylolyticum TaxID=104269 RepID=UPI003893C893
MKRKFNLFTTAFSLLAFIVLGSMCTNAKKSKKEAEQYSAVSPVTPIELEAFKNHRDSIPSKQEYNGNLFQLSHNYPTEVKPVVNPSWQQALQGQPISDKNALIYMDSLKSYVAANLAPFFTDNKNWNAADHDWYHQPWLGNEREAILGTYLGNGNPANMFESLKVDESGYVLVLYDETAAYTVGQIWGKTGAKVNLVNDAAQFKEGSVIVKLAFSNINAPEWPVMEGAQIFNVYDTIPTKENPKKGYQVRNVSFFQMDIVVKDSKTAPKTGWVYSTFVYDQDQKGSNWDKLVPLGAMWGNDPDVKSPIKPPYPKLNETVINANAPKYSKETLGWGGRLSGPNDGAVAQVAYDINTKQEYENLPLSSCMSCHSPAQYKFNSFLLPAPFPTSDSLIVYTPGSTEWMRWFRDDYGNVPFDAGQIATDYDMVTAFKAIPAYEKAMKPKMNNMMLSRIKTIKKYRTKGNNSLFWH